MRTEEEIKQKIENLDCEQSKFRRKSDNLERLAIEMQIEALEWVLGGEMEVIKLQSKSRRL